MNEAMPNGRTFGVRPTVQPPIPARPEPGHVSSGSAPVWLVPLLSGLGGAAAGAAVALLAVMLLGTLTLEGDELSAAIGEPLDAQPVMAGEARLTASAADEIVVDVAGAVARPGLHRLWAGDRVGDAIEAAGGYAPRVDLLAASERLNLAQPLQDGIKVLVPELGIDRHEGSAAGDGRIDLNSADQAELESLPGVGPVTARKILDARAERRFSSARDLRARGLVGESVFEDLQHLVQAG